MNIIIAMPRYCHLPGLRGVLILSVIAPRAHEIPAISFHKGDDLLDLHQASSLCASRFPMVPFCHRPLPPHSKDRGVLCSYAPSPVGGPRCSPRPWKGPPQPDL